MSMRIAELPYRLKRDESLEQGLRRIAAAELKTIRRTLRDGADEASVHAVRKSIKKLRAIVRIITDGGGRVKRACKHLREASHSLSLIRDADSAPNALARLRSAAPRVFSEHTFARITRRLTATKESERQRAGSAGVAKPIRRCARRLKRPMGEWRLERSGRKALRAAIRRAHDRAGAAVAAAKKTQTEASFHRWRKELKSLYYMLRLVDWAARAIRRDVALLRQAEALLGEARDVSLLHRTLGADAQLFRHEFERFRLSLAVGRIQTELRAQAIAQTRRIFLQKPDAFAAAVTDAWLASRRRRPNRRRSRRRLAA